MIRIHEPRNDPEVSMLRSILTAYEIPHFIQNDHFGSLLVGPLIPLVNAKAICVGSDRAEEACALVRDYLEVTGGFEYHPTVADKVRVIVELLLFNWIVLGSLRRKVTDDEVEGEHAV